MSILEYRLTTFRLLGTSSLISLLLGLLPFSLLADSAGSPPGAISCIFFSTSDAKSFCFWTSPVAVRGTSSLLELLSLAKVLDHGGSFPTFEVSLQDLGNSGAFRHVAMGPC